MASSTIVSWKPTATDNASEYSLTPDVAVILMEDGSARVLDMGDSFYAVPPIGALFLQKTLQHGSDAATEQLAAESGVDRDRVEADMRSFLTTLEQRGIIQRHGENASRKPRPTLSVRLAAFILKIVLAMVPFRSVRAAALLTLAKLSFRIFGWTGTVTAWRRHFQLPEGGIPLEHAEAVARDVDDAVCSAAAWNPFGVACKERALCCWALARAAGLPAALVIGVELFPLSGHCWCEVGPWIVSDHPDNCARYTPALRYT